MNLSGPWILHTNEKRPKFRTPESVTTMNRSPNLINVIGRPRSWMMLVSAFAFVLTLFNANASRLVAQSSIDSTGQTASSRRILIGPPSTADLAQVDCDRTSEIQLETSSDQADDSDRNDSRRGPEEDLDEDTTDDDAGSDDEDDDQEGDTADDEDEPEDEEGKSELSSMMINTDIRSLRVNIAETSSDAPADQSDQLVSPSLAQISFLPSEKLFAWAAPDIRYQPLYFENVPHERYGQTPEGCELRQTFLSAVHFYGSLALLPYKFKEQNPHSCDGPLGFCRPGSQTPFVLQRPFAR